MLSSGRVVGSEIAPERETHRVASMDFLGNYTRCPRALPYLLQRSSPEQACGENVVALGRESQFFVSFYFFGSIFLRGQRTILGMPPLVHLLGRNQYAPKSDEGDSRTNGRGVKEDSDICGALV